MTRILLTIAAFLALYGPSALACTCHRLGVAEATRAADVVFAGRVEEVTMIDSTNWEPRAIVRFKVARAWKGPVVANFVMHTNFEASSCAGFFRELAQPGKVLLVYGYGVPGSDWKRSELAGASNAGSYTVRPAEGAVKRQDLVDSVPDGAVVYTTDICTRTMPVVEAVEDFKKLGKAREFGPLDELPDPVLVESLRYIPNKLPVECGDIRNGRKWTVLKSPPANAANLVKALENGPGYDDIPKPLRLKYRDYWAQDAQGTIGFCRLAVDTDQVCGNANGAFNETGMPGQWNFLGSVYTYCKNPDGTRYDPRNQSR